MAGFLARGSPPCAGLPSSSPIRDFPVALTHARLAADSCGGSHGLGPFWVVRPVFPFKPLDFIRRGTITHDYRKAGRAGSMSSAPCFVAFGRFSGRLEPQAVVASAAIDQDRDHPAQGEDADHGVAE